MNTSTIVWTAAIALLIFVVFFYKYPKKSSFKVPNGMVVEASEVPLSQDRSPPISALNDSYFRGGDFASLVASPSVPTQKVDKMPDNYLTPAEMLGPANMTDAGQRFREDGSIHNDGRVIAIDISRDKLQTDCISATFNIGSGEGIRPINSVHKFQQPYVVPTSILFNTSYDTHSRDPQTAEWYRQNSLLRLQSV
jgi:hypothetical protein